MSSNALFFPTNSKTQQTAQSFPQTLSDTNHDPNQENATIYVHPLVKKSSAKLSTKSLEMCTEGLGSETGCDIMEEMLFDTSSSMIHKKCASIEIKAKRECKYPPPLTSFSNSISVETYREHGRLVVNAAVFVESSNSLFQAERIDGRLILRFKKWDEEDDEFHGAYGADDDEGSDAEHSVSCSEDLRGNVEGNIGICRTS